jgi:hypothetical protein
MFLILCGLMLVFSLVGADRSFSPPFEETAAPS